MSSIIFSIEFLLIFDLYGEKCMYIFYYYIINRGFFFFKVLYFKIVYGFYFMYYFDV